MLKTLKLLVSASLLATSLNAVAGPLEDELEPLPKMGPSKIAFDACTASGNVVTVHFDKILNFLKTNPAVRDKPAGMKWATKEENAAAALKTFERNYRNFIAHASTPVVMSQNYLPNMFEAWGLKIREVTYYEDGREPTYAERDRLTLGLKIILETQMELMLQGKFAYMSIVFNDHAGEGYVYVTYDRNKDIEHGGCDPVKARKNTDVLWVNPYGAPAPKK